VRALMVEAVRRRLLCQPSGCGSSSPLALP
jgi:hypothetical protein